MAYDKSEERNGTSGVGPLTFLLHINDIGNNVSEGTHKELFADGCLLHREIDS